MKKQLLSISFTILSFMGISQSPADALDFDGTNDYVLLPTSVPSLGTSDCTFEAWVYPKVSSSALQMILAKDQSGDPNSQFRLAYTNGAFKFSMSNTTNANVINIISSAYPINNWYHVAAVREGTMYTLYVNGAVVSTTTTPVVMNSNNPAHPWSIGARKPFAQDPFTGSIDELRIWMVARTKCEINTYKNCEIPSNATGLIANYHFNQGIASAANSTVTNLIDNTSNTNTGVLTNFALAGATSNWISPGGVIAGSITPLASVVVNTSVTNSIVCSGLTTMLTASGAHTYTWTGGVNNGFSFIPSATTIYTVTGTNTLTSCSNTAVASVTVIPSPTVTVNSGSICSNNSFTLVPNGAATYTLSGGVAVVSPTITTSYTITGTANNGCLAMAVSNVTVQSSPNVTAYSSATAICVGNTVALYAVGAVSYSWNGNNSAASMTISPTTNTMYVVTGSAANLCTTSKTINITVNALPTITITASRSSICAGEKIVLTGSGASTYSWVSPGVSSPSIQVNPTITTNYVLNASDAQTCVNSKTFQLIVSACTGIEQAQIVNSGLVVYPNPNNGVFSVKSEKDLTAQLVNELGQVVHTISLNEMNQHFISISDLSNGIYFLIGRNEDVYIKEKIIVSN